MVHYSIGTIVNGIPRLNMFFRVFIPKELLKKTSEVADWAWFTKDEFLACNLSPSYKNREELAKIIFS